MTDLIPAAARPYLLLIKIGLITAAAVGVYVYAHHAGTVDERQKWEAKVSQARQERIDEYETQIRDGKAKLAKLEADSAALGKTVTDEQGKNKRLSDALARANLVTHDPNPIAGQPPVVRLSRQLRLCVNAAALGTESEIAGCEAYRVPVSATP